MAKLGSKLVSFPPGRWRESSGSLKGEWGQKRRVLPQHSGIVYSAARKQRVILHTVHVHCSALRLRKVLNKAALSAPVGTRLLSQGSKVAAAHSV